MKLVKPYNQIQNKSSTDVDLKNYEKRKTFHEIMRPILTVAQFFGILPVTGIRDPSPTDLKFTLFSWRFVQSIINLCAICLLGFSNLLQLLELGVNFYRSGGVLFYSFCIMTLILFMKLARFWPKFMKEWATVEYQLSVYPPSCNLQKKLYTIAILTLVLATLDHILSIFSTIVSTSACISKGGDLQAYFEVRFIQVFNRISFTYWIAAFCQLFNIIATFAWTFIDMFLILISVALTELFQRITNKVKSVYLEETPETVWLNIREDFNKISVLCRLTNTAVSDMILLSFTSNLCSICAQILHSINPMKHFTDGIYFFYSMLFLMIRTLFFTLMLSKVHQASREPLTLLFQVPRKSYCLEIGRFIQQITSEVIALTGMNFFAVRKEMILSVAGTILTYELVLIQFNAHTESDDLPPPMNITYKILLPPCSKYDDANEIYMNQLSEQ